MHKLSKIPGVCAVECQMMDSRVAEGVAKGLLMRSHRSKQLSRSGRILRLARVYHLTTLCIVHLILRAYTTFLALFNYPVGRYDVLYTFPNEFKDLNSDNLNITAILLISSNIMVILI